MSDTATVTLLFCDLVGSTELLRRIGDDANDVVRRALFAELSAAVSQHRGVIVKTAGDGMMVAFETSAADAVACGIEMQRAAMRVEYDDATLGLQLRIGISSGDASREHGDWFGTPVVEAARLEAAARPSQILTSEVVRSLVGTRGGVRFRAAGTREFKGFERRVPVVEVLWEPDAIAPPRKPPPARRRTRARRRILIALAGSAVVALVFAGAVVWMSRDNDGPLGTPMAALAAEEYVPTLTSIECPPDTAVGDDVRCEMLVVPESRAAPTGRQVRLRVTTYPARGGATGPPIIVLGGFADNEEESEVREFGDYVSFDIRGGSQSEPHLTCPEIVSIRRQLLGMPAGPAATELFDEASERCGKRLDESADLNQYGVADSALDVRDLLIAKGWSSVTLQANADWSRPAILFSQDYPGRVRALVIVDPLPFDAPQNTGIRDADAAISAYEAACSADDACGRAHPDLSRRVADLYAELQARPLVVPVPDPARDGEIVDVYIDGNAMMSALIGALNQQSALPLIASLLGSSEHEATVYTTALFLTENAALDDELPWGLWHSRFCEDTLPHISRSGIEALAAIHPMLREFGSVTGVCSRWPTEPDSVLDAELRVTQTPALIFAGTLSPYWPPAFAQDAARAFVGASVAVMPNLTSAALEADVDCIADLRRRFLEDPSASLDIEGCATSVPALRFEGAN